MNRLLMALGAAIAMVTAGGVHADPAAVQGISVTGGVFFLDTATGRVSYCYNTQNTSTTPTSTSNCKLIGDVGASASGYVTSPAGTSLFIVSKKTGAISHCVINVAGAMNPTIPGTCTQRANTTAL